jgi:small subunit ribosomal protein S8e
VQPSKCGESILYCYNLFTLMAIWQGLPRRTKTGARIRYARKKRKFEISRERQFAIVGIHKVKHYRTRGANKKIRLLGVAFANVTNPETKETKKVKVLGVIENPANPHYVQRNIVTKGAKIQTELGPARVVSRPGQHGVVNAILLK